MTKTLFDEQNLFGKVFEKFELFRNLFFMSKWKCGYQTMFCDVTKRKNNVLGKQIAKASQTMFVWPGLKVGVILKFMLDVAFAEFIKILFGCGFKISL